MGHVVVYDILHTHKCIQTSVMISVMQSHIIAGGAIGLGGGLRSLTVYSACNCGRDSAPSRNSQKCSCLVLTFCKNHRNLPLSAEL